MRLSYNEACAMKCSTLEKDLELCEKAGFDYIEIRLDMLSVYLRNHTFQDLKDYFATHRLKPAAINALYPYEELFSDADSPEKAQAFLDRFYMAVNAASEIGSNMVIVVAPFTPDGKPYTKDENTAVSNCVRILKQLGRLAGEKGVSLALEPVGLPKSSVRTVDRAIKILDEVALDNVGCAVDCYNIYLYHKRNDFNDLRQLRIERIFAVHINNGENVPEEQMGQDKRCFADKGDVDVDTYLKVLWSMGYRGMVSIEVFRPEYWEKSPEWVIQEAFRTTANAMWMAGCLKQIPMAEYYD